MLSQDVISLMEKKARHELEDRRVVFERGIAQIKERMAGMDAFSSGGTVRRILDAIDDEYRIRTRLIWQAFARVLSAGGVRLDNDVASRAKTELAQMLDEGSEDIHNYHRELHGIMRSGTPPKSVAELREAAIKRINTEIDCVCLERSRSPDSTPSVSNLFYQCSGIIQTGSGSITVNSIGHEEHRAITNAIEASKCAIAQDLTLDKKQKDQAGELISDLEAEISRPEPNSLKVRVALLGLAMTVQTLAAAPGAYQLVKGAAALFGLALP